ncbi:hypothetical protein GGR53DRAFT_481802 [Hypoxylon sp. FL1150]|nr:hypothetical protein GGR53DRAFT_481802 [Hypoxylon sp. FL1150]
MVTATLTRPTSIAATSSCETKVALVEKVDIGLLVPPRERRVCMQTLRRRAKKKKKLVQTVASTAKRGSVPTDTRDPSSDMDSTRVQENSNGSFVSIGEATPGGSNLPRSPLRSDFIPGELQSQISGESVVSNNSGSNSVRGADASAESIAASRASGSDDREITATVELLKGGCLPGDILPVKIRVEHNRRMKSMHGVIVTLYRQGRVDYSPPISLFTADLPKEEAERLEREDYYPRSRTGLGGLSLSSAGSCSVFRKDLSQAVAPLIIDPTSLTANITTSVRVPEDVFPSIKNVPGGLISFKYHVEVVLDLGGKLAGHSTGNSQQANRMNALGVPGGNPGSAAAQAYDLKRLANWSGTVVDTDHLRREKGVISVSFEVVVGTMDSTRSQGKPVVRPALAVQPPASEGGNGEDGEPNYTWQNEYDAENGYSEEYPPEQLDPSPQGYFPPGAPPQTSYYDFQDHEPHAPAYIPPPEIAEETELSEKERVRQAEQRLLPSRPHHQSYEPDAGPSQSSSAPSAVPTHLANNVYTPNSHHIPLPGPEDNAGEGPSAPPLDDLTPMGPAASHADDKEELERRRLLQEASAPPEVPEDYDGGGSSAPPLSQAHQGQEMLPTAPVLHDDDHDPDHDYGAPDPYHEIAGPSTGRRSEQLPRYER